MNEAGKIRGKKERKRAPGVDATLKGLKGNIY